MENPPFDSRALARLARALRVARSLTQQQVADAVGGARRERLTQQAVALAEREGYEKSDVTALRVRIVEHLSGRRLSGPRWDWEPGGAPTDEGAGSEAS